MGYQINLERYSWRLGKLAVAAVLVLTACSRSDERALQLAAQAQEVAEAGDLPAARRLVARAVSERDDIAAIYLLKGQLDLRANVYREAYDSFTQVLALDAANVEALRAVSELALSLGQPQQAAESADRLLAIEPGDRTGLFVKGMADLQRRNPDAADRSAQAILGSSPTDALGLILKARVLYYRGQTAEAVKVIEAGKGSGDQAGAMARTRIELYRADGRAASLIQSLSTYISQHPDHVGDQIDRANVYYKTGRTGEARAAVLSILTVTTSPDILDQVTSLWYANDNDPLPAGSWRRMTAAGKAAATRFYLSQGNLPKAGALMEGESTAEAAALRVRIAMQERPDTDLFRQAERILAQDATQCDALVARARYLRSRGQPARAVRDATQAVAECPGDAGAVLELAAAAREDDNLAAELRAFDEALQRDPQSFLIGRAYVDRALQSANGARAVAAARQLTRAAPAAPAGWVLLVRACRATDDASCVSAAERGLTQARKSLYLDPRPGASDEVGPLGRLTR